MQIHDWKGKAKQILLILQMSIPNVELVLVEVPRIYKWEQTPAILNEDKISTFGPISFCAPIVVEFSFLKLHYKLEDHSRFVCAPILLPPPDRDVSTQH